MKNKFKFFVVALAIGATFTFVGCSSDDDPCDDDPTSLECLDRQL